MNENFFAIIITLVCIIGGGVLVRRFWLAVINPKTAYEMGRKARCTVEGTAYTVGQVSATVETATGVIANSFRKGRDSVNHKNEILNSKD